MGIVLREFHVYIGKKGKSYLCFLKKYVQYIHKKSLLDDSVKFQLQI